ncbi:MAG: hypothetical protein L3J43_03450 [Sulfurovum sp.]|nr:hypothetical protein [Sulfurovum sp.]
MFLKNNYSISVVSIFLIMVSMPSISSGVEIRVGSGKYDWKMGVSNLLEASADMNSRVVSIVESHQNFENSKYYFEYSGDFYWNKFASDIKTSVSKQESIGDNEITIIQNKDYETSKKKNFAAADLNFGLGYDLYHENNNYFGISINTGYVSPTMNLTNKEVKKKILKKLETEISLYKLGITLQGKGHLSSHVFVKGNVGFGLVKGSMEYKWLDTSEKVNGDFKVFDLSINYKPSNANYYLFLGALYKSWSIDKTEIDISEVFSSKSYSMFALDFSTSYAYVGIGYDF